MIRMAPFIVIACINCVESIEHQCITLFNVEDEIYEAILEMVDISLNLDRHWCDDFIYEAVLASIVDVLESKERCIEIVGDFINEAYGDVVVGALCEMQNRVKEIILKLYFNPNYYLSSDS